MRSGIVFHPSAEDAARRWAQEAETCGHELAFCARAPAAERVDVVCAFGPPSLLLETLFRLRGRDTRLVWWCSHLPDAPGAFLKSFSKELTRAVRRMREVHEVLAASADEANQLAALSGLQAAVLGQDDPHWGRKMDAACRRAAGQLPSARNDPYVPRVGHVLPYSVPHDVPGFTIPEEKKTFAFAPEPVESEAWFNAFADRVEGALGREYLPVCRMSDGEFLFRLGWQPHLENQPLLRRLGARARRGLSVLRGRGAFRAGHPGRYQSAQYSADEQRSALRKFDDGTRFLAEHGILALHLSHERMSFQERFYPAIADWLRGLALPLDTRNYVPFYFVYALLTGPRRKALLDGRRVLVVNGATGEKRARITTGLEREGAEVVHWETISAARSLFDKIDVSAWRGHVDLAVVGAGVGKVNVLPQLASLGVPCLDAGYVFEVWADPASSRERFYCTPDASHGQVA